VIFAPYAEFQRLAADLTTNRLWASWDLAHPSLDWDKCLTDSRAAAEFCGPYVQVFKASQLQRTPGEPEKTASSAAAPAHRVRRGRWKLAMRASLASMKTGRRVAMVIVKAAEKFYSQ
jgi:hypothetical protein